MRKAKLEIKDKKVLDEILSEALVCRLALMDGDLPYIVPVNYGYKDGSIYIHSAPEGKKIDLLLRDNRVCFEVEGKVEIVKGEKACAWTTRYRSVVGYASVDVLSDDENKQFGLEAIMAQSGAPDLVDFEPKNMKHMVILKLTITSLTGKHSSI